MTRFITEVDYRASLDSEILGAITRSDRAIIELCEDRAISQLRGLLSMRYDCDLMFSARGAERNILLVMMTIDVTLYHIFSIHNPHKLTKNRVERYERALDWAQMAGTDKIDIEGAPKLQESEKIPTTLISSNAKRINHF